MNALTLATGILIGFMLGHFYTLYAINLPIGN